MSRHSAKVASGLVLASMALALAAGFGCAGSGGRVASASPSVVTSENGKEPRSTPAPQAAKPAAQETALTVEPSSARAAPVEHAPVPVVPVAATEAPPSAPAPVFELAPGAVLTSYTAFYVDPVGVGFAPGTADGSIVVDPERLKSLSDSLRSAITDNLSESLTLAGSPGPGVMRLRVRILGVANQDALSLRESSCRVEVVDGASGTALATFRDSSTPRRLYGSHSTRSEAELASRCIAAWSELLAQRLDEARGG